MEQKTANEPGEFPEIDLYRVLREAFPGDNIRRVKRGETGADIVHDVMHKGQQCPTIAYDSKNREIFQGIFVQKLLVEANAKAEHAVIVTAMFPSGHRDLCMVDGVIVARPQQVVTIAALLRDSIITDHLRNLSFKDRTVKKERLYALITSQMFRQRMASVERAIGELEKIDTKEEADNRKVWAQRPRPLQNGRQVRARPDHGGERDPPKSEVRGGQRGDGDGRLTSVLTYERPGAPSQAPLGLWTLMALHAVESQSWHERNLGRSLLRKRLVEEGRV